ncbi:MAG: dihydroxyacetone kinase family protein [Beutenbergiaceae bacterium]
MTKLFNDPADFPHELIEGFAAAYPDLIEAVPGGVVRSTAYEGVAVIAGGGTGHYPAFCGLVGQGLVHGAAMGNVFSSPSSHQVYTVAKAAERGHGVVFTFGNYAGDVLHFGEAAERLRAEGIPADIVLVTDDIASAPAHERHKRRGIAGDLAVFKILGAAADEGRTFEEVIRLGNHANDRARSFGIAFAGCTLPGAERPLFAVPEGMMSLGLGIHGEPGIEDVPLGSALEVATLLVERVLAERPEGACNRISVLLNGLGTVKYEELFVTYRTIAALLAEHGLVVVSPDVGELCTSLNMSGISLTIFWLDDELERLWTSASHAPAYRKGSMGHARMLDATERAALVAKAIERRPADTRGTAASQEAASCIVAALRTLTRTVANSAEELGRIDAIAGDGDHGIGMERGARAALRAAEGAHEGGAGAGTVLRLAGEAWADVAGGTSGALWGTGLKAIGREFGDHDAINAARVAAAVGAARAEIGRRGRAKLGDKTMMDVLIPYSELIEQLASEQRMSSKDWLKAAELSLEWAALTRDLVPQLGRARPLAERSVGAVDAGAWSLSLIISAVTDQLTSHRAVNRRKGPAHP